MSQLTTPISEYSDNGNTRTYAVQGHLAAKPFLVIQKRSAPGGVNASTEMSFRVIKATTNAIGDIIPNKASVEVVVRCPNQGKPDDLQTAFTLAKEIIASDEFRASVTSLTWLK